MVTTFGDLRHESNWQAGTMDPDMARKRTPVRSGDADAHLPHEAVGLLVAQALNWDPQQIVEAFTIALKQVSEKGFFTRIERNEGKAKPTTDPGVKHTEAAPSPERQQPVQAAAQDSSHAPTDSHDRMDAQSVTRDQFAQAADSRRAPTIEEVKQQFITFGGLVLEAIEAMDPSGREAAS